MITLTSVAADKLGQVMTEKGLANHALRVFVSGGGCSGLAYGMAFAQAPESGDQIFETNGVKVIIDPDSFYYMDGAEIDFIDTETGGAFRIENPNAAQTCSCGSSAGEGKSCCG